MADEGRKREFRIDSSDSARPPATISDVPYHYAQGLKPKPRVIAGVAYEAIDGSVSRGKGVPPAKLILRTTTYDDGVQIDTTVGEDNEGYQAHLLGEAREDGGVNVSTRRHTPTKQPSKATKGKV